MKELWVEKYRPQSLEEYVGNEMIKNKIPAILNKDQFRTYSSMEWLVRVKPH